MPERTRSRRAAVRFAPLALVAVLGLGLVAGCSSSGGDDASATSTSVVDNTSIPTTPTTSAPTSTDSSAPPTSDGGPLPGSPSTLPPDLTGTCGPLGETYGIDEIRPRDSSSWVDERQRVVVDGRREAQLLSLAGESAPATVAGDIATLADYATFVADTVEGADSYPSAIRALDAGRDRGAVDGSAAAVAAWRAANC